MDPDTANVTYVVLDGYVDVGRYRFLYFVVMLSAFVLILCTNSTVVGLIVVHRNLHEPMYVFIAALLVNSLLFSSAVYPKLLMDFLSEQQVISYSACLFQWFAYYCLASAEFLLLSFMAYDRYVSICRPLRYPTLMRRANVALFLAAAWPLPACQTTVPVALSADAKLCRYLFKGIICSSTVLSLHCLSPRPLLIYGFVSLVNLVLLPVLFILYTYTRILVVSYCSCRDVRRKAAQTCLPHLLVLINYSCLCAYDVLLVRLENNFPKAVNLVMTLQITLYHPLFNPIIYGLKMTEIYRHLRRLIRSDAARRPAG